MKIVAAADLHGFLPEVPRADVLLLAGDILPEDDQERWMLHDFRDWLRQAPVRRTIFIAGNHDFYFQSVYWKREEDYFRGLGATYLEDSGTRIGSIRIWGTPWLPGPSRWAFSDGEEFLRKVPATDILLSHSPPQGILDRVGNENVGSSALAAAMQKEPPRAVFFGHIHECGGEQEVLGDTTFYNVSLADPRMQIVREPLCIHF